MAKHFNFKNIFILSILFRIIAVIFSKGYAFSDDHFEVIEVANKWLHHQALAPNGEVYIFNLIYILFHSSILWLCNLVSITNPDAQMLIVRFFHALFSLFTVYYGYKIAQHLFKKNTLQSNSFWIAKSPEIVALLLGLFWLFPFMSVRSLREFFCIPFLMIGFYHIVKIDFTSKTKFNVKALLLCALFFALAFVIRLQTMFFPAGVALALLLKKEIKIAFLFGFLFLFCLSTTQFLFDYLYWGNPLASLLAYVKYNAANYADYPNGAWYKYIFTVAGVFLFPASILFILGFFQNFKARLLLFLPSFLFLFFHSIFPNKQERFILSVLPFIIILGVLGFAEVYTNYLHKKWFAKFTRFSFVWFFVINTIGLIVISFTYSKKSRIESLLYLREKNDVRNVLFEAEDMQLIPSFYYGKPISFCEVSPDSSFANHKKLVDEKRIVKPNYIVFLGEKNLAKRIQQLQPLYPVIEREKVIAAGFTDNIAYYLNPKHNVNESWFIYKVK